MIRLVFCVSIVFAGFLYWQDKDTVKVRIDDVSHPPKLKEHPQIFDVKGTVTLPPKFTGKDDLAVIVYCKSDSGGRLQLQMSGSDTDGTREPRSSEILEFTNNTANWTITQIWLGGKEQGSYDPYYTVYAVVVKAFDNAGGKRLISLTNNEFSNMRDVLAVLQQGGFQPLAWTDKKGVER
jgi:hypothetical protein